MPVVLRTVGVGLIATADFLSSSPNCTNRYALEASNCLYVNDSFINCQLVKRLLSQWNVKGGSPRRLLSRRRRECQLWSNDKEERPLDLLSSMCCTAHLHVSASEKVMDGLAWAVKLVPYLNTPEVWDNHSYLFYA